MYSVVKIGGSQYKVNPGDQIDVEKLTAEAGSEIELEDVLFVGGGDSPVIGTPIIQGAKVKAKVIRHDKARKIAVLRRMAGKWKKQIGHRQQYTALEITSIEDGSGNKAVADKKPAKKTKAKKGE